MSEAPSAEGMAAAKRKAAADGQVVAAKRAAAPPLLTSEEARQQAQPDGGADAASVGEVLLGLLPIVLVHTTKVFAEREQ